MKLNLTYGATLILTIVDVYGEHWNLVDDFKNLQSAVDRAEAIFNECTVWNPADISEIFITDANTAEIVAECFPDDWEDEEGFDNPNYDFGTEDWEENEPDYNEIFEDLSAPLEYEDIPF